MDARVLKNPEKSKVMEYTLLLSQVFGSVKTSCTYE